MSTIKEEIMSIAEAQGYEGEGGSTIAEAVNALGSVMGGGGSGGAKSYHGRPDENWQACLLCLEK